MRKLFNFFAAALVMLAAASCEKNEVLPDNNSEGKVVTLKASINNGGTKTSLGQGVGEEGDPKVYPVLWSEGDAIAVIQGEGKETKIFKFVLEDGISTTTGVFQLKAYENCGYEVGDFDATKAVKAFYPFEGISLNDGSINYTVPATQTYTTTVVNEVVCSTFGNGASPMAAYADNAADGLSFENLFGVVKLQLTSDAVESLRCVEFVSDKAVSGSSIITINDVSSSIILAETPNIEQKKVVLECENPVELSTDQTAPTTVHIAVPGGVEHEFSVYIVTDKGAYSKKVSSAKEIVAGEIKKMGGLNLSGPEFEGKRMSYVENGVYLGEGVALPAGEGKTIIWAPVNCGYERANGSYKGYPYGKLYQWGRKYGQGYKAGNYEDATYPSGDNWVTTGPVEMSAGQNAENKDKFYIIPSSPYDWVSSRSDALWNRGSVDAPVKTDYDPCPAGWRVPTSDEMKSLSSRFSPSENNPGASDKNKENFDSEKGYYFYGVVNGESSPVNKVFFPAAGDLLHGGEYGSFYYDDSSIPNRGYKGYYWTSTTNGTYSHSLIFGQIYDPDHEYGGGDWYYQLRIKENCPRASGFSVRCVKDMPQSQPMPGSN